MTTITYTINGEFKRIEVDFVVNDIQEVYGLLPREAEDIEIAGGDY